ncbi:MAG: hypothetical protein COC05_03405 [Gammaproteobacteria bacterium]|nr:MAG: hypothetical protein COC05_03405 [Gammaproteobacteria bacterium]
MKIQGLLDASYEASGKASDLSRQLAFAGIAIIWLFRVGGQSGGVQFSEELLVPLYCFVAGLTLDLGQYVYKAIVWSALNWYHWRKHKSNQADVDVSGYFNAPTHILFWGKVALIAYGYILLLGYIRLQL